MLLSPSHGSPCCHQHFVIGTFLINLPQVLVAYRQAAQRAILLDWGGTLTAADTGFYDLREEGRYEVAVHLLVRMHSRVSVSSS